MKDMRFLSLAIIVIAVTLIAVPAVQLYESQKPAASTAEAPPMPEQPSWQSLPRCNDALPYRRYRRLNRHPPRQRAAL